MPFCLRVHALSQQSKPSSPGLACGAPPLGPRSADPTPAPSACASLAIRAVSFLVAPSIRAHPACSAPPVPVLPCLVERSMPTPAAPWLGDLCRPSTSCEACDVILSRPIADTPPPHSQAGPDNRDRRQHFVGPTDT